MIPLYIIEEHHEVFYIWNKAADDGFLPLFGNTLLHVDHHPDFECEAYGVEFDVLFSSLDEMREFTYTCLGIADFICPAIYQGIFNEVVILQNYSPLLSKPEDKLLKLAGDGCLTAENPTIFSRSALSKPEANHRFFTVRQGGLGDFSTPQTLAMDIDLDYFCWDDSLSSVADKQLEITERSYRELTQNPYHPFRLLPKAWLRPVQEDGRFYLRYMGLPNPQPFAGKERVKKRMDLFRDWLVRNELTPCMISICRSRYSGYTPSPVWEEIEKNLLESLAEVYTYDLQT